MQEKINKLVNIYSKISLIESELNKSDLNITRIKELNNRLSNLYISRDLLLDEINIICKYSLSNKKISKSINYLILTPIVIFIIFIIYLLLCIIIYKLLTT